MPQPQLGYGHQTEATIDQVNQWMRSQPWWQQIKGQSGDISESQKRAILQQAQANGVVVDQGDMEIDKAGNFNPIGHKLRNTLIVAGIAGAAIAAPYVIPALTSGAPAAAAIPASGVGGMTATSLGLPVTAGLGTAGAVGGGTAGTIGTAAKIGGLLSGGKGATGYLDTAGRVADAIGAASSGRAAGRATEAQLAQGANRNIIDLYRAQQDAANSENAFGLNKVSAGIGVGNLDLNQKQFSLDAPGKRASNSVRGDILANAQDAVGSGISPNIPVPTITGGLRPSMFSANTRALGGEMSSQALKSQQAGDQFSPLPTLPDYKAGPAAPSLTDVPQAGKLDSILNVASSIGGLMGSIPYKRTPQPGDPDYIPQPYVARR